jgi:hypothetical protein
MANKQQAWLFILQTDGVYTFEIEKYAPPPQRGDPEQDDGSTWWHLSNRDEAIAMCDRVRAAFPKCDARVCEFPPGAEDEGWTDWRPSVDGLTLVREWDDLSNQRQRTKVAEWKGPAIAVDDEGKE